MKRKRCDKENAGVDMLKGSPRPCYGSTGYFASRSASPGEGYWLRYQCKTGGLFTTDCVANLLTQGPYGDGTYIQ